MRLALNATNHLLWVEVYLEPWHFHSIGQQSPVVFTSAAKRSEWPRQVDCNLETWAAQKLANPWTCSWILGHLVNPPELHHDSGVDLSVDSKSLLAWLNRYIGDLLCDCMLYCTIMYIQCVHAWPILSEWLTPTQIPQKHIGHPQTLPDRELYTKIIKIKISYHILNQHISVHTSRP